MIKLSPVKRNSDTLIIYCSVVPHNFPPRYRINFVRELSRHFQVIFVDLPGGSQFSPISSLLAFYISLVATFFKFESSFAWEFFPVGKIQFFTLFIYLLLQKLVLGKKIILYTTSGYYDRVYRFIPFGISIFDCPDVHRGEFENNKNWIRKFNLVFANTKKVFDFLRKFNANVRIIPSGYRYASKLQFSKQKIADSVLFLGGISQRIDYDLLGGVIKAIPDAHFYFIGEVYLKKYYVEKKDSFRLKKWQQILAYPNVHYLGEFSQPQLEKFLPIFEIGIIPYSNKDVFNRFSNPIKLYDYLTYGMFVVSTPLPNIVNLEGLLPIYIASNAKEFADKIKLLLKRSTSDILKYKKAVARIASGQSIERKTSRVVKELKLLG